MKFVRFNNAKRAVVVELSNSGHWSVQQGGRYYGALKAKVREVPGFVFSATLRLDSCRSNKIRFTDLDAGTPLIMYPSQIKKFLDAVVSGAILAKPGGFSGEFSFIKTGGTESLCVAENEEIG